jgi:predicted ArsR family transcriptional regulator/anti-sigma regulatory factor (Ser/Thr protein kinase)
VDWFLGPSTPENASALRVEIGAYLRRHASDPAAVPGAEIAVAELINNAVEHVGGRVWVCLEWTGVKPVLVVHDLGPMFELDVSRPGVTALRGRGLWLVSVVATDLAMAAKRAGGKRVSATLPVERWIEPSFDFAARVVNPLPGLSEAGPDGFGRESFLRALVVEQSRTLEEMHGPGEAQQLIARVGATVGEQMETEYRAAADLTGELSAEELASCYVRLKSAIGGGFYVIDVSEDRIVLGNTRCPFGDAVREAPSLCRMTSSVFGGIAARNRGRAVVQLDERIAVGDPGCRVTVLLGTAAEAAAGHHYRCGDVDPAASPVGG